MAMGDFADMNGTANDVRTGDLVRFGNGWPGPFTQTWVKVTGIVVSDNAVTLVAGKCRSMLLKRSDSIQFKRKKQFKR